MGAEEFGVNASLGKTAVAPSKPTSLQRKWLMRGIGQPGGKLPLFDDEGQRVSKRTVDSCLRQGWAEPWFANPMKPDWLVCKLTDQGRQALGLPGI